MGLSRFLALPLLLVGLCSALDLDRVRARLADLGSDEWSVREAATEELERMGKGDPTGAVAKDIARSASSDDAEVVARCRWLLDELAPERFEAVVQEVEGDVEIELSRFDRGPARAGMRLEVGTVICTGSHGHVRIGIGPDALVTLGASARLSVGSTRTGWRRIKATLYDLGATPCSVEVHPTDGRDTELTVEHRDCSVLCNWK